MSLKFYQNKSKISLYGLLVLLPIFFCSSCSITYYDKNSQTVHVIGLSHVSMRVPDSNEGNSVFQQVTTYGLSVGTLREGGQLSLGYSENTVLDISDGHELCFMWPSANLIDVQINKNWPEKLNGVCNYVPSIKNNDN